MMRHPHTHEGSRRGGPGRTGGWQQANLPDASDAAQWLAGRLPYSWFVGSPTVTVDREEIVVLGELPPVSAEIAEKSAAAPRSSEPSPAEASSAAAEGRISRFRESTRAERMAIATEAQARYGRTLSWGASLGQQQTLFTHLSTPVMTRLRQPERQVLDTLVDAGVARSRSDALAWAVKLVGEHSDEWLTSLRAAMAEVEKLRGQGPAL